MQSGASHADRTLSRSCPTSKSKNFVSRARATPLRSVSRLGAEISWASSAPPAPVLAPLAAERPGAPSRPRNRAAEPDRLRRPARRPPRTKRRSSPLPASQDFKESPSLPRSASPRRKIVCLGISGAFPWAWTWFQVLRGPEELEGSWKAEASAGVEAGRVARSQRVGPKDGGR